MAGNGLSSGAGRFSDPWAGCRPLAAGISSCPTHGYRGVLAAKSSTIWMTPPLRDVVIGKPLRWNTDSIGLLLLSTSASQRLMPRLPAMSVIVASSLLGRP
jgi:hypothetical protein